MPWPNPSDTRLSPHFKVSEFEVGTRGGLVPVHWHPRLKALCDRVLEPIREAWGVVRVTSGYRPADKGSQHSRCEAADIHLDDADRDDVWYWLMDEIAAKRIDADQAIIYEDTGHIHVSYTMQRYNRREIRVHVTNPAEYGGREYPLWSEYHGWLKHEVPTP